MKNRIYGYARVSTLKQNIERQIANIKTAYPDAVVISESYTGTKMDRPAWSKLAAQLREGDTVVFDEVSRMSRNAAEGYATYEDLYRRGVNLIFLKEPHINSSVYRDRAQKRIESMAASTGSVATDKFIQAMIDALNAYSLDIVQEQIQLAFSQAQAEVDYMRQRTSEGVRRAQASGKQVGLAQGTKLTTKKSVAAKEVIRRHCRDFGGSLSDPETQKLAGISRNSYYKYKAELREEAEQ